jgi:hypothetical protein
LQVQIIVRSATGFYQSGIRIGAMLHLLLVVVLVLAVLSFFGGYGRYVSPHDG